MGNDWKNQQRTFILDSRTCNVVRRGRYWRAPTKCVPPSTRKVGNLLDFIYSLFSRYRA